MSAPDPSLAPAPWPPDRWPRWLPPALLCATFVSILFLSWGKWPDVIIDFGHELYAPWQITQGKLLGRDIAWGASGPLSPYLNALLFRVFGTGLWTLMGFNLLVLAVLTVALHALLREIGDVFSATAATLAFLAMFAFGQYGLAGSYNYVAPYSHGATHGMALALLAVGLLHRYARTGLGLSLAGASFCLGLTFLAKPEIFAACAAAFAVCLAVLLRDAPGRRARVRLLAVAALPALLPPALAFGLLSTRASFADAWRSTVIPWLAMASPLVNSPFYALSMGLDEPVANLARLAAGLAGLTGMVALVAALDLRFPRGRARRIAVASSVGGLLAASWAFMTPPRWLDVARPLPALLFAGAGWLAVRVLRGPRPCPPRGLLHLTLAVLALGLLAKMALHARVHHYGFVLAMPGTMLAVTWLAASLPRALETRGGSGQVARAAAACAVILLCGAYVRRAEATWALKDVPVGRGADAFVADRRGVLVNAILEGLEKQGDPGGTLAVMPEGAMINYLSRRVTPSPYLTYLPDAVARWGEPGLLAPLERQPPAFLAIVSRDTTEHGPRTFGLDYGLATVAWMRERYEVVGRFGDPPFQPYGSGAVLLRRRDGMAEPATVPVP